MLVVDDYNHDPERGEMQKPVISKAEAKRLYNDFWNYMFYKYLMIPYSFPDFLFDFGAAHRTPRSIDFDDELDTWIIEQREHMEKQRRAIQERKRHDQ